MSTYYGLLLDLGAVLSWRVPYRRDFYFICFALNIFSVDLNSTSVNSVCSLYFSVDFSHVTMKPKVYLPLCVDKVVLYSILLYPMFSGHPAAELFQDGGRRRRRGRREQ